MRQGDSARLGPSPIEYQDDPQLSPDMGARECPAARLALDEPPAVDGLTDGALRIAQDDLLEVVIEPLRQALQGQGPAQGLFDHAVETAIA